MKQQLLEGHSVPPDTARAVGLWIKLSLAKLSSKHSYRNVALFLPAPFGHLMFLLHGTEGFYFVQVQAANLADIERGFGGHLVFLRVTFFQGSFLGLILQ